MAQHLFEPIIHSVNIKYNIKTTSNCVDFTRRCNAVVPCAIALGFAPLYNNNAKVAAPRHRSIAAAKSDQHFQFELFSMRLAKTGAKNSLGESNSRIFGGSIDFGRIESEAAHNRAGPTPESESHQLTNVFLI